ncbi:MAG: transglycosylase domain-containing protein [Lachnospiraceae bacterium]|nr:transglycosylase domain-containing protein [Lachnospiraceae bacterium]
MNFNEKSVAKKRKALAFYNLRRKGSFYTFLFRVGMSTFLVACFACFGLILGFIQAIYHNTPTMTINTLAPQGEASILYDSDGKKIISLEENEKKDNYTSLNQIPQDLQNAVIAIEDSKYYSHTGIDVYSIINGLFDSVTNENIYGSTSLITEQLIENMDPEFSNDMNLFGRMEYRMRLHFESISLEQNSSKPEILEYYLNTISFGNEVIGVEAASQVYFNKNVQNLSLSECAILASIISNPTKYNPRTDLEANKSQRLLILEKMKENDYITEDELNDAIKEDSYAHLQMFDKKQNTKLNDFSEAALQQLFSELHNKYNISATKFHTLLAYGGLNIYTTQNTSVQNKAETIINDPTNYASEAAKAQACVTILDQSTGQIQAIIGNHSTKSLMSNRATEDTRQPGSLFQILATYLPGIDTGTLTLASSYEDAPYQYLDNNKEVVSKTKQYQGLTTVREAIPSEMNTIAARAQSDVTAQTSYEYLLKLGFQHLIETSIDATGNTLTDVQQSICSGNLIDGVTNMEITQAVSTLGNSGYTVSPRLYTKVTNNQGIILFEKESSSVKTIQASTAFLITDALKQPKENQIDYLETACLRGSTQDETDYWYTGYTPNLTTTVWLGYDDERAFDSENTEEVLWKKIMLTIAEESKEDQTEQTFTKPANLVTADICEESGKLAVPSICDHDPRGNRIRTEYFAPGTVPTTTCNTHVEVTICKVSGMLISNQCPKNDYVKKVFISLPQTSAQTMDIKYLLPKKYLTDERCTIHSETKD